MRIRTGEHPKLVLPEDLEKSDKDFLIFSSRNFRACRNAGKIPKDGILQGLAPVDSKRFLDTWEFFLPLLVPLSLGCCRKHQEFHLFQEIYPHFPDFLLRKASPETRNSALFPCGCYSLTSREFLQNGFIRSGVFRLFWEYSSSFCLKNSSWGD